MKNVSLDTAEYLREIGFPQDDSDRYYADKVLLSASTIKDSGNVFSDMTAAPSYMEAWLWLFGTKKHIIEFVRSGDKVLCKEEPWIFFYGNTVEEAMAGIIDYLASVNNTNLKTL